MMRGLDPLSRDMCRDLVGLCRMRVGSEYEGFLDSVRSHLVPPGLGALLDEVAPCKQGRQTHAEVARILPASTTHGALSKSYLHASRGSKALNKGTWPTP